ncbi:MAG: hypothetical protein JWN00_4009 [Actinomycetia bacterium]|nr:hypothetical protein [Actinomycetes bacterium]
MAMFPRILPEIGQAITYPAAGADGSHGKVFLTAFLFVFATTGIGNGSTYRMTPAIYGAQALTGSTGMWRWRRPG